MCCTLLSTLFPNTALLFDLSFPPHPNPHTILFHPFYQKSSDTPGSHSHLKSHHPSNLSFIFPPPIFPSLRHLSLLWQWEWLQWESVGSRSGPLSPCPLTLHIYADGLDGSHPHPVVGLAVVATPLHPLDALDAQRLIVDGCFLELVWRTACRFCPPDLEREREGGG